MDDPRPRRMRPRSGAESLLLPALFCLRPQVAVSAFAALGRLERVRRIAVHADGLVKEPVLSLFETGHLLFLWQTNRQAI